MDFNIHPFKGVNGIQFGMPVATVRARIPVDYNQFRRGSEAHSSDFFVEASEFAYYDADGHLEAMEFSSPARILLGQINLLSLHLSQIVPLLAKLDPNFSEDRVGAGFRNISVGIYAPRSIDEEDAPVEAVLVGRPGHFCKAH